MLDHKQVSAFIAAKRRARGLTQQQVAEKLHISFQAVSKWESGASCPNTELLLELAQLLEVSVDELLRGRDADEAGLTYSKAGVDILYTDAIKSDMAGLMDTDNPRVLNKLGAFAALYDISFPDIEDPVLVLKAEEPGSKQKLAMEYGYTESICHDMINHLVNDIIVMGATPLAVLDTIICGSAEKETIKCLIKGISDACRENECVLVGGETSVQPNVVDKGTYILTSSIAGIVERKAVIDGSGIREGDIILAVASNGVHTNGYSLIRLLMEELPHIKNETVGGEGFLDAIMKPHAPYYASIKRLVSDKLLDGMAHITGGGIEGNVKRIMPDGLCAEIDLAKIRVLPLFQYIQSNGNISESEMLGTFNCGVGLVLIVSEHNADAVIKHVSPYYDCYAIGVVRKGSPKVKLHHHMNW